MNTPICDFVNDYIEEGPLRLHMPGHKGVNILGCEVRDITEIEGADSLYEATGIIRESEENAGRLFGCKTFYSTEGSSLCIRAMLYLARLYGKENNLSPLIVAGRNAHKTFLCAAAALDIDIEWLYPEKDASYLSCEITPEKLEKFIINRKPKPMAVYVTSPDYLGNISDIKALSKVCHKNGILLIVDNAHGAYLKFLPESLHPIDLGADMCCDSAHKTLPVLTGGAYLHISKNAPENLSECAKEALGFFGSTSPSYLILQSLDAVNKYLSSTFKEELKKITEKTEELKIKLLNKGYTLYGNEPLKITIQTKPYGYTGEQFAALLKKSRIVCEFSDPDFVVLMLTPQTDTSAVNYLEKILLDIPKLAKISNTPPVFSPAQRLISPKQAIFGLKENVPLGNSAGRIFADICASCPPAVPVLVCGERIDENSVKLLEYYGATTCKVIKE